MRKEEESKRPPRDDQGKERQSPTARLIAMNLVFFTVVAAGLMWFTGHTLTDLLGPISTFWAAKQKDESL
jgi:hypothetical protein